MRVKRNNNIAWLMFLYWIIVIIWQTVRPVANRSIVDTLVKMGMFGFVGYYGYNRRNVRNTGSIQSLLFIFIFSQIITILLDTITLASSITVVFMIAEIVIFLVWMRNEEISYADIEYFGTWIIRVAVIMAVYNIAFNTQRFLGFFRSGGGAYGRESRSFLYSNHEFALYLAAAILFTGWFYIIGKNKLGKTLVLLALLASNMLSTYSRTATFSVLIAALILSWFAGKKYFSAVITAYGAAAACTAAIPGVRRIVMNKILKGSIEKSGSVIDNGRANMYKEEIRYFFNGDFFEKLFGHGYVGNHAGGHNAYLSIANTGGIVMLLFFLTVILWSIKNSLDCLKKDRLTGAVMLSLQVLSLLYMCAQTPILFFSTMDSFFITAISVMLPLYMANYLKNWQQLPEENV